MTAQTASGSTPADAAFWRLLESELASPAEVVLENGVTLSGHPTGFDNGGLQLGTAEGAGEILHTLHPDRIRELRLPGDSYRTLAADWMEAGETTEAVRLMAKLFEQRVRLLPFLEDAESHFFIRYLQLVLQSGDAARAIAVSERLDPQIRNPLARRALDDAVLEAYQRLGLHEKAVTLARDWVAERHPYGASALGYYVLAAADLRSGRADQALETALEPVVFSSAAPMDCLEHCYAIAAAAALELREPAYALCLFQEMQQRRLPWPDDPELESVLPELEACSPKDDPADHPNRTAP